MSYHVQQTNKLLEEILNELKTINEKLDNGIKFDATTSSNVYGEGLVDGIQNAIERGLRGINTYG